MTLTIRIMTCSLLYIAAVMESRAHSSNSIAGFVPHNRFGSLPSKFKLVPPLHAVHPSDSNDIYDEKHNILDGNANDRRSFLASLVSFGVTSIGVPLRSMADETVISDLQIQVLPTGDVKKLFNEGRALEAQGNILAAQRLYTKITKVSPGFIYGWSSLGNTLTAQGELITADDAYSKAITLCEDNLRIAEQSPGTRRCDDLYLLLLNRGSVRLNNNRPKDALMDLQRSNNLRARPDAVILQNLARAQELNSQYSLSDKSYNTAISMTANEVNPFWIRSSMVKYQLGDLNGAMDLMRRVENRFPEAPEVRAAYAVLLLGKGDEDSARKKFLEIPDRQRVKYADSNYLNTVVAWPPVMQTGINYLAKAVGDVSN